GATNLVTAAAYAQLGAMPMVMITGQKPINSSKQGRFQIIDVVDMMRPITKSTHQIISADGIPARVRNAFLQAEEERPGAVHLELPEDVARQETTARPIRSSVHHRPISDKQALEHVASLLKQSRHPVILIGAGANRKDCCRALRDFIAKQRIPFVTTQMGKGVADETDSLFLGTAAMSSDDYPHRALELADLILNVGHDVVEKPPFFMNGSRFKVIHINYLPAEVDPVYFPDAGLLGDIATNISLLNERTEPQPHWNSDCFKIMAHGLRDDIKRGADDVGFPLKPRNLVSIVRETMPEDGIITLDNGVYKIWFARNYPARHPNTILLDNALATMGAGLPSAMAAKLVHPDKRVMAICGDGGFMMNSQDLETAVRLRLDLVVLVLNDSSYGMIRWKQAQMGFADFGLQFGNPDFVKYAESYGATGHRVAKLDDLGSLMNQAFKAGGVHLIDAPVDYSQNGQLLFKDIPRESAALHDQLCLQ
ncbi:MAG: acetolactate synthase large subunit, partial [Oceanipulchritudo sp.]